MPAPRISLTLAALSALLAATACQPLPKDRPGEPKYGSLNRHLTLIDSEGRTYGTIDLEPLGNGRLYDTQGKLVGMIIPPQYTQ